MRIFLTHVPDMLENYYGPRALAEMRRLGEVRLNETGKVLDAKALALAAKGCEVVVSDRQTPGPAEFFPLTPDLCAFLRVAVDIRNIDVEAASREGVLVTRATPGFMASVSEMAIGMMIDCARKITDSVIEYRNGGDAEPRKGVQLNGATVGIMGYGAIARHLAPICTALGMTVLVSDPFAKVDDPAIQHVDQNTLLAQSDFVICLVIANEETENLMNAANFARMKKSAYFLNLSRGNLVDESALLAALEKKQIAGAAIDVGRAFDHKPSLNLASRSDVIATPHTAGLTPDEIEHQAFDTVRQVADLVAGSIPPEAVNRG
ncbi:MAG: D-3-phosphoglycerate dehydrogenase / 2-oxoglutarate reductase, partial [Hyphomicrobiales bacterium]|nr:D-3-phosphoglycerate dehydrogenase / 2-oxoglutarate reductase [Hyphomicrobiales bacterium]